MRVNHDPAAPARKPCWRDLHVLTHTLLTPEVTMFAAMPELERRAREIDITHPHFQEETPIVLALEQKRRHDLALGLKLSVSHVRVA